MLAPRPNTAETVPVQMVEITDETLRALSKDEAALDNFLLTYLGIAPRTGWTTKRKLGLLVQSSCQIYDS